MAQKITFLFENTEIGALKYYGVSFSNGSSNYWTDTIGFVEGTQSYIDPAVTHTGTTTSEFAENFRVTLNQIFPPYQGSFQYSITRIGNKVEVITGDNESDDTFTFEVTTLNTTTNLCNLNQNNVNFGRISRQGYDYPKIDISNSVKEKIDIIWSGATDDIGIKEYEISYTANINSGFWNLPIKVQHDPNFKDNTTLLGGAQYQHTIKERSNHKFKVKTIDIIEQSSSYKYLDVFVDSQVLISSTSSATNTNICTDIKFTPVDRIIKSTARISKAYDSTSGDICNGEPDDILVYYTLLSASPPQIIYKNIDPITGVVSLPFDGAEKYYIIASNNNSTAKSIIKIDGYGKIKSVGKFVDYCPRY